MDEEKIYLMDPSERFARWYKRGYFLMLLSGILSVGGVLLWLIRLFTIHVLPEFQKKIGWGDFSRVVTIISIGLTFILTVFMMKKIVGRDYQNEEDFISNMREFYTGYKKGRHRSKTLIVDRRLWRIQLLNSSYLIGRLTKWFALFIAKIFGVGIMAGVLVDDIPKTLGLDAEKAMAVTVYLLVLITLAYVFYNLCIVVMYGSNSSAVGKYSFKFSTPMAVSSVTLMMCFGRNVTITPAADRGMLLGFLIMAVYLCVQPMLSDWLKKFVWKRLLGSKVWSQQSVFDYVEFEKNKAINLYDLRNKILQKCQWSNYLDIRLMKEKHDLYKVFSSGDGIDEKGEYLINHNFHNVKNVSIKFHLKYSFLYYELSLSRHDPIDTIFLQEYDLSYKVSREEK